MTSEPGTRPVSVAPVAGSASASWHAHVADRLQARKNEATEAEIGRLSKTLARLQGAASAAQVAHAPSPSFTMTLDALSDG